MCPQDHQNLVLVKTQSRKSNYISSAKLFTPSLTNYHYQVFLPNLLNNVGFILSTISYKWGRLYIFCPFDELVWLKHLLSVTCKVFVIGIMFTKGWHAVNCNKGFYFFNVWGWGGLCSGHRWREFRQTVCASFSWILIFNNLVWMYWKRKYKFKLVLFSSFSHIVE